MAARDAWDYGSGTVQVLGCYCWNRTLLLLLPSPNMLPECHVPAGLDVLRLQWHSWVCDSLAGMSSAVSTVSAESQTHRIIHFGKSLQDH